MRKILLGLLVLVLMVSFWYVTPDKSKDTQHEATITYDNATANTIVVDLPFPDAVTGKEFTVIGKARGPWYFEASFPVFVLDASGTVLVTAIAQAQSDWMTNDFVPFEAYIKVPESYIGKATLLLKKDNPSGRKEHDASISFPIHIEY